MIDKGLYTQLAEEPGLETVEEPGLEIMIENPDDVEIGVDGLTIDLMPDLTAAENAPFDANLVDYMDKAQVQSVVDDLDELIEADITARKDWADTFVRGMEVLGLKYEERTEPWENACGVFSTLLSEAAIRFQSETIMESFPSSGPVRTKIIGQETPRNVQAAERVRDDMNYQLMDKMSEYRSEHERMLYSLGLAGAAFKKVYFDPSIQRQVSVFISAEDVIVPYGATNMEAAERVSHIMRKSKYDMAKLQASGFYTDVDLGEPMSTPSDIEKKKAEVQGYEITDDNRFTLVESHAFIDLPGFESEDGVPLPYIVSYEKGTRRALAIRRNWVEPDELKQKRQHFVHYPYIPGFGFYGMGLIHVIGGYARAGTSLIRQLIDAGTLSNLPGGLKTRGLRIKGDDTPIAPGEFRDVDVPSGSVRDNIMTLPYKEPSQVLLALLNQVTDEGRRLGSIADLKLSDMSAQAPVGTTLALLERQLKTMGAVQARVHYAMKQEFQLLKEIIADYAPSEYEYVPVSGAPRARKEDYAMVEVVPVSDPNSSTMAQRIVQYQAAMQLAQQNPQVYDLPQLNRQMLEVLGVKNAEKLVPLADDARPRDPISENMAFLNGKPTKAFIYQDHQAHIAAHQSFLKDPMVLVTMGENPLAQKMQASALAHIAEHLGYQYRRQVEERLGVPMPGPDEDLPEDAEVELSRMVAQAAVQLQQMHQQQAQQQQAQQQAQDPLVQMQQKELEIKEGELQRKVAKDQTDAQLASAKLELEAQKEINNMVKPNGQNRI